MLNCGYDSRMIPLLNNVDTSNYDSRLAVTKSIMNRFVSVDRRPEVRLPVDEIEEFVYRFFKQKGDIAHLRKSRRNPLPQCRQIISMLLYQQHNMGCSGIESIVGKDHSTVLHYFKILNTATNKTDPLLSSMIMDIKSELNIGWNFLYVG